MATKFKPDPVDALTMTAEALRDYVVCFRFVEWLIENNDLSTNDAVIDTRPQSFAYDFAIRFSRQRALLDSIIAGVKP
jgi:hypothetical protein